jgi:hypothetical protein
MCLAASNLFELADPVAVQTISTNTTRAKKPRVKAGPPATTNTTIITNYLPTSIGRQIHRPQKVWTPQKSTREIWPGFVGILSRQHHRLQKVWSPQKSTNGTWPGFAGILSADSQRTTGDLARLLHHLQKVWSPQKSTSGRWPGFVDILPVDTQHATDGATLQLHRL